MSPGQRGWRWWLRRIRLPVAVAATVAIVATLGWFWYDSRVPGTYSVMEMGYLDAGGGPDAGHSHGAGDVSVAELTGPADQPPDAAVTLTARQEQFTLGSGETVEGYTLNHTSPGPEIRASEGELVEVRLVNESVEDGVTLHWHGVDIPNAEDGVAGVTQDAVATGDEHIYRFRIDEPGSYWYHSHQVSHEQVKDGLFGALVIEPAAGVPETQDVAAAVHTYDGRRTISGHTGVQRVQAAPGERVRVRVVNTDNSTLLVSVTGAPYQAAALDARDISGPTDIADAAVQVAAGGRADLTLAPPADGTAVRVDVGAGAALVIGPAGAPEPPAVELDPTVDFLSYGTPAPTGLDPAAADRRFEMRLGRRPGFLDGKPGLWWTMNGRLFPDVPMYLVREGDVAVMTISNSSGDSHPMHLHGHHVLVLSRDGEPASGSPWWTDSLDVENGQTFEVAFRADNPGIWMDHCHNLQHAVEGMVVHLAYEGVTTPYLVGGEADNEPE
jgi:FtsP/CotA-like multicopper oxidase with cupredoxin domain